LQLGWDITDFGSGCFQETGLTLLTLRNGALSDSRYPKPYAERCCRFSKISNPWHFHYHKMEDIINRGGGNLCMQLAWATEDEQLDISAA
jgi:D-lyxose ketol-isomerase